MVNTIIAVIGLTKATKSITFPVKHLILIELIPKEWFIEGNHRHFTSNEYQSIFQQRIVRLEFIRRLLNI